MTTLTMTKARTAILAVSVLLAAATARGQTTIDAHTTLLIGAEEPAPIQKAAQDLAADMTVVLGSSPRWARRPADASPTTICIAYAANLPRAEMKPAGWETLRIQETGAAWPGSPARHVLVLTGSDVRGVVYAIYEFSQRFLRVDPLYWWTDHPPARRASVAVPAGFSATESPTFHYRGWFMNDEDLLTGWSPGDADGTGISLKVWNRIFEALLRLKGDMIIPGTFVYPDEPQVRAAGARGLIINQHHMEPLGLNAYQWPPDVPYSLERLTAAWRCSAAQYARDQEMVWTVGLRGKYDRPFWADMPDVPPTPAGKAATIRQAIDAEMAIVRGERPGAHPRFIMNTWMEGIELMTSGALKLPEDVALVWADDGAGMLLDGGRIARGNGVYYHTAVIGGNSNHFTERVPIERLSRELGRAVNAGATAYLMLNPSDLRPVPMTTRAVMELAWNSQPFQAPNASATYLRKWSREEFGERAAPVLARYYDVYFRAPARYGTGEDEIIADNYYPPLVMDLLVRMIKRDTPSPVRIKSLAGNGGFDAYARALGEACRQASPRWKNAAALAQEAEPLVPADRRQFFQAHVMTELHVHEHWNKILADLAGAASSGVPPEERLKIVQGAIAEIQALRATVRQADYGKWEGFHTRGDWFDNLDLTLAVAQMCESKLKTNSLLPAQQQTLAAAEHYLNADTSNVYIKIKAYQKGRKVQFCEEGKR
jgi:hypothetical protein